jgi:hypothetical protein
MVKAIEIRNPLHAGLQNASGSPSTASGTEEDKATLDYVPPEGPAKGIPIVRDVIKLPAHFLRFLKKGASVAEVWGNERAQLKVSRGAVGRFGLWRRSALILGSIVALVCLGFACASNYQRWKDLESRESQNERVQKEGRSTIAHLLEGIKELAQLAAEYGTEVPGATAANDSVLSAIATFQQLYRDYAELTRSLLGESDNLVQLRRILYWLDFSLLVVLGISVMLLWLAALNWQSWTVSSRLMRWSFLMTFLFPFMAALIPYARTYKRTDLWPNTSQLVKSSMAGFSEQMARINQTYLQEEVFERSPAIALALSLGDETLLVLEEQLQFAVESFLVPFDGIIRGAPFAILLGLKLIPVALGLLPGILSASSLLRLQFPHQPLPGFLMIAIPPLHAPLTVAICAILVQLVCGTSNGWFLVAAVYLFALAPFPLTLASSGVISPYTANILRRNIGIRQMLGTFLKLAAVALVITWLVLEDNIPEELVLDTYSLITAIFNFLRGFFLTNLVFSDAVCWIVGGCVAFQRKSKNGLVSNADSSSSSWGTELTAKADKSASAGHACQLDDASKECEQLFELTGWMRTNQCPSM